MEFTFDGYKKLVQMILSHGYTFANYLNYKGWKKPCILRHDVDYNIQIAERFAEMEQKIEGRGVKSTYFILLSSDFYNVYSKENYTSLCNMRKMGHEIGLHFDEQRYKEELNQCAEKSVQIEFVKNAILKEVDILSNLTGCQINAVSMHRPSEMILDADLNIPNVINSYESEFFKRFKYVSDSRMHWREDVAQILYKDEYMALHVLTHPVWYSEEKRSIRTCLNELIKNSFIRTYENLYDNFRNLDEVITKEEILCKFQKL